MKQLILNTIVALSLILVSCNREPINPPFNHDSIIGSVFQNSINIIEFISKDSLIWEVTTFADTTRVYRLSYQIMDNDIQFKVADTIRTDYVDSFTGKADYILEYFEDRVIGTFTDLYTIDAHGETHGYTKYYQNLYPISISYLDLHTTLKVK